MEYTLSFFCCLKTENSVPGPVRLYRYLIRKGVVSNEKM